MLFLRRNWLLLLATCVLLLALASRASGRPSSSRISDRQVERIIESRFGDRAGAAKCIAAAESNGDYTRPYHYEPRAISPTFDYGLFQINRKTWGRTFDWSRILDPVYNTEVAWRLSARGRSWGPWSATRGYCGV